MKRFILFIICGISLITTHAQTTDQPFAVNKTSDIHRLVNGKYAFSRQMVTGTDGRWFTGKEEKASFTSGTLSKGKKSESIAITHHIIFHFDKMIDMVVCDGTDTTFFDSWNMVWTSDTTLEADMPDGYYYFFCFLENINPTIFYAILQKNFHVYKDMDTTILSTSAIHTINLVAYDENGNPVVNHYHNGDCLGLNLEFPDWVNSPYASIGFCGITHVTGIRMSDFPPETKTTWCKTDVTNTLPYKDYVISFPILTGISHDTTQTITASDYRSFPLSFHSSPEAIESYFGFGDGIIQNDSLLGYADYFAPAFVSTDYPGRMTDTIKLFIAEITCDTNKVFQAARIVHVENFSDFYVVATPVFYLTGDQKLDLSCGFNFPPVEGDYRLSEGNSVIAGSSAPYTVVQCVSLTNNYLIKIIPFFKGQANERRDVDRYFATWDLWKGNQHLVHDSLRGLQLVYGTMDNSTYTVILNDSNYTLYGVQGYLQSSLTFDLSKSDPNSPTVIAFKAMQGDSMRAELIHGYPASIRITAGDFAYPYPGYPIYHALSDIQLQYKDFNDTAWFDLPLVANPDLLDPLSGMPYSADLEQVMNQFPDSALIDVRIFLTDSAGNSNTQTIHPAFLIRDALVGAATKNENNSCLLFPNPASEMLHIGMPDDQITVLVYSSAGQLLMEASGSRMLDISGLQKGFYIVSILESASGKKYFGKFIK